jgi:hypothetical protein
MNITTRRQFARETISAAAGISLLGLTNCGSASEVITVLNTLISTASEIVNIAFPQYGALLGPYEAQLTAFVDAVTTELSTTDTVAQKVAVISAAAGKIVAPDLTGLPQQVVTDIQGIAPLISQVVSLVQQLSAAIDSTPGGEQAFFAAHKVKPPSAKNIAKVRANNAALKAKLAAARK